VLDALLAGSCGRRRSADHLGASIRRPFLALKTLDHAP
jgi:hypothetical protein